MENFFKILGNSEDKYDLIFLENLEHFLNKKQMDALVKRVSQLLTPGGKFFTTAHNFCNVSKEHAVYKLYLSELQKGSIYPGFLKFDQTAYKIEEAEGDMMIPQIDEKSVAIPKDDELCSLVPDDPVYDHEGYIHQLRKVCKVYRMKHSVVTMRFTPEVYERVYSQYTSLKVVESFYMDCYGRKQDKVSDETLDTMGSTTTHCVAIIEKQDPLPPSWIG